jgi:hypothetical protein
MQTAAASIGSLQQKVQPLEHLGWLTLAASAARAPASALVGRRSPVNARAKFCEAMTSNQGAKNAPGHLFGVIGGFVPAIHLF